MRHEQVLIVVYSGLIDVYYGSIRKIVQKQENAKLVVFMISEIRKSMSQIGTKSCIIF